jgi:hypothetical protein
MRHLIVRLGLAAVVAAVLSVGVLAVSAQDEDMMMGTVVCDSDVILNLYVAEYYFGFGHVMDSMMMAEGSDMMGLDLAVYDKGQYADLFDSMMADTMMSGMVLTEDQLAAVEETMSMGMMDESAMMEGMTTLVPAAIDGEPAECTALRTELASFYTALAHTDTMAMSEG